MHLRQLVPAPMRLRYKLMKRHWADWSQRSNWQFARSQQAIPVWPQRLELQQPVRQSTHFENKQHNIRLGFSRIGQVVIQPGQLFSFWKIVGPPTAQNGFRKGRNLLNGQLTVDYGGGLCQLSGMIYYLALQAGFDILERYNHSLDIYTDETRFAPLGSDATVVYGYKDLRFMNTTSCAVRFSFKLDERGLHGAIHAPEKLKQQSIHFLSSATANECVLVETKTSSGQLLATSTYRLL
ncbi:MAG: VanW family protein [Bacteroidota bacterium]